MNSKKYVEHISLLIGIIILISTDLLIAKNSLPLTEGWWEVIAKSTNYKELYKDLYIGLPPLYINFISFLQVFSENIYYLRLIFICIHIVEIILLAYFFSRFFSYAVSISAVIISELLISCYITTYLTKDYHLFLQLLINCYLIASFYFYKNKNLLSISLLSIFTCGIMLTKQNYGVILFAANYIMLFAANGTLRTKIVDAVLLTALIFLILFGYTSVSGFGWISVYLGNDSKGSVLTIITRVVTEKSTIQIIISLLVFYTFYYLKDSNYISIVSKLKLDNALKVFDYNKFFKILVLFYAIYIGIRICSNKDFNLVVSIVYLYLIISAIKFFGISKRGINYKNFGLTSIPILGILYCNTLTAGYNFSGFQVGIAVLFCLALSLIDDVNKNLKNLFSILLIAIIGINFYNTKYINSSYSWWGYRIDSVQLAKYHLENKYLNGVNLTEDTFRVIEKVADLKTKSNSFYFYPNIPLFYYIFDIDLQSKFPVLWFDVVPNKFKDEAMEF